MREHFAYLHLYGNDLSGPLFIFFLLCFIIHRGNYCLEFRLAWQL